MSIIANVVWVRRSEGVAWKTGAVSEKTHYPGRGARSPQLPRVDPCRESKLGAPVGPSNSVATSLTASIIAVIPFVLLFTLAMISCTNVYHHLEFVDVLYVNNRDVWTQDLDRIKLRPSGPLSEPAYSIASLSCYESPRNRISLKSFWSHLYVHESARMSFQLELKT